MRTYGECRHVTLPAGHGCGVCSREVVDPVHAEVQTDPPTEKRFRPWQVEAYCFGVWGMTALALIQVALLAVMALLRGGPPRAINHIASALPGGLWAGTSLALLLSVGLWNGSRAARWFLLACHSIVVPALMCVLCVSFVMPGPPAAVGALTLLTIIMAVNLGLLATCPGFFFHPSTMAPLPSRQRQMALGCALLIIGIQTCSGAIVAVLTFLAASGSTGDSPLARMVVARPFSRGVESALRFSRPPTREGDFGLLQGIALATLDRRLRLCGVTDARIMGAGRDDYRLMFDETDDFTLAHARRLVLRRHVFSVHEVVEVLDKPAAFTSADPDLLPESRMPSGPASSVRRFYRINPRVELCEADVEHMEVFADQSGIVQLRMNPAGSRRLEELSSRMLHQQVAIVLAGEVFMAPRFETPISGDVHLAGRDDVRVLQHVTKLIKIGCLPLDIEPPDGARARPAAALPTVPAQSSPPTNASVEQIRIDGEGSVRLRALSRSPAGGYALVGTKVTRTTPKGGLWRNIKRSVCRSRTS